MEKLKTKPLDLFNLSAQFVTPVMQVKALLHQFLPLEGYLYAQV